MNTQDTVIEILEGLCPGVDCRACEKLVEDRHLDSLTMVALVADLEDAFDVEIPPVHAIPENFNSAAAICSLVERLMDDAD